METLIKFEDDIQVEGITADHVWYHADLLSRDMGAWSGKFQKLIGIMEERHKEHLQMIGNLLAERTALKAELSAFKQQKKE